MERLGRTYHGKSPRLLAALRGFSDAVRGSEVLDQKLVDLVFLRASQLNGCGFCVEMHVAEAQLRGEQDERLHAVAAFRHSGRFTAREKAALALTEAVTRLDGAVADDDYAQARAAFKDEELVELTFAIGVINVWNRLNVTFETPAEQGREFVLAEHRKRTRA